MARLSLAAAVALTSTIGISAVVDAQTSTSAMGNDHGAFFADCGYSHSAPDDPIVFPGQPGLSHLHDFIGAKTLNADSTNASIRQSPTTCLRANEVKRYQPDGTYRAKTAQMDHSAYWAPTLYDNGVPVKPTSASAYYTSGRREVAQIQPFPEGLRMIAGDAKAKDRQLGRLVDWMCTPGTQLEPGRSPDNSPRARALRAAIADFEQAAARHKRAAKRLARAVKGLRRALRRQKAARRGRVSRQSRRAYVRRVKALRRERRAWRNARKQRANRARELQLYLVGGGTSIPTCKPDGRIQLGVRFPDCWDGKNLDSADHKSHMAYSFESKAAGGWVCPPTHPVLVPKLFLVIRYPTRGGPDIRLSPGDVDAGHADFMNGWNQEHLTDLVRTCLNTDKYCGSGDQPAHEPAPTPTPSPTPSPEPDPTPTPSPEPDPTPTPTPEPDPIPPLPLP